MCYEFYVCRNLWICLGLVAQAKSKLLQSVLGGAHRVRFGSFHREFSLFFNYKEPTILLLRCRNTRKKPSLLPSAGVSEHVLAGFFCQRVTDGVNCPKRWETVGKILFGPGKHSLETVNIFLNPNSLLKDSLLLYLIHSVPIFIDHSYTWIFSQ